jgi:large repetitive protein
MQVLFLRRWWLFIPSLLLLAGMTGCGGRGVPTPGANPAVNGLTALPVPLALTSPHQASEAVLFRNGREYDPSVANNVDVAGETAKFTPQAGGSLPLYQTMAYALYRFNVSGKTGPQTLRIIWNGTPPDAAKGWIGFANWENNRWDWQQLPENGTLALHTAQFAQYTKAGTSELLCLLGLTGGESCTLQGLGFKLPVPIVQWPMFGHDPQHTFRSDYFGTQTGNRKWTFRTSGFGINIFEPAVAPDGTIYIADAVGVSAYAPQGNELWRFTPDSTPGSPVVGPDGTVLFGTGRSESGDIEGYKLYALNPDGTLKWTCPNMPGSPIIGADGMIYVLPSIYLSTEGIVAINPDGTVRWSIPKSREITGLVATADGKVFYTDMDGLHALDADQTLLWTLPGPHDNQLRLGPDNNVYCYSSSGHVYSVTTSGVINWDYVYPKSDCWPDRPAFGPDGMVYVAFYRNNTTGTTAALCALTPAGELSWSAELLHGFYAVVVTASGNICAVTYSMDHFGPTELQCFDSTGALTWTKALPGAYTGYQGLEALPDGGVVATTYDIGTIYAVNADGSERFVRGAGGAALWNTVIGSDGMVYIGCNDGTIYAVDNSGGLQWKQEQLGSSVQTPLINNNTIYTTSYNRITSESLLRAFDLDGTPRWNISVPASILMCSPTPGPDGTVYFGSGRRLNAVDATGALQWSFLTPNYEDFVKCPAISPDGSIYANVTNTSGTSMFLAFNDLGQERWNYASGYTNESHSPSIGADGTLYVCYGLQLIAMNPDGTVKWIYSPASRYFILTPALAADGTIYIPALSGGISAVNPDGTSKWDFTNQGEYCSTPAVDAAGKIYFSSSDNNVYCVDAAGQLVWKQPVHHYPALAWDTYSSPAIAADGTVYVGAGNLLYAFGD